jgi:hypothetical protein
MYACSLFITVQFRGDFGIISDLIDASRGADFANESSSNSGVPGSPRPVQRSQGMDSGSAYMLPYECIDTLGSCIGDIFDVPIRDFTLLLSPPAYSYGSKMQSVAVDLKEV